MISALLLLGLFSSGAIFTILNPIVLPAQYENALYIFLSNLWGLNGILPIYEIFDCLNMIVAIGIAYVLVRLFLGLVSMLSGAGKPEV